MQAQAEEAWYPGTFVQNMHPGAFAQNMASRLIDRHRCGWYALPIPESLSVCRVAQGNGWK